MTLIGREPRGCDMGQISAIRFACFCV